MIIVAAFVLGIILYFVQWAFKVQKARLQLSAIPQPPLYSWYSGHKGILDKAKENNAYLDQFVEWVAKYGNTVLFWQVARPFIFTSDPVMINLVLTDLVNFTKVKNLPNRALFGQKIAGYDSLLSGNGLSWGIKRKVMSRFFAKLNMANLFKTCKPHMENAQLEKLKQVVGAGETVELVHQLGDIFTSYLHVIGFPGLMPPDVIYKNVTRILELIPLQLGFVNMDKFKLMFSGEKDAAFIMIKNMRNNIEQTVQEKADEMLKNEDYEIQPTDGLAYLIEANKYKVGGRDKKKPGKKSKSNYEIVDQVVDDIMSICLVMDNMVKQVASMFIFLKDYPEVQQKMFAELRANPISDYDSISMLQYTEKCLLESMRMAPALLRGTRMYKTGKRQKFGPYKVHAPKLQVFYSEYVHHYDEKYWDKPREFNPERWNDGFKPKDFTYLPFILGPRSCLGKYMAMFMMKLTLSVIARNFDLSARFDEKKPPCVDQNMATMRIRNRVDYHVTPVNC